MHLNDEPLSLYDVLELTPDATPQEIRSAYLRLKSAYNKDNIAHYTLFSRDETEKMIQSIENAYVVLSNPEKRKSYDLSQNHSAASSDFTFNGSPNSFGDPDPIPAQMAGMMGSSSQLRAATLSGPAMNPNMGYSRGSASDDSGLTDVDTLISAEQEWSGASIRRIREARRISLDDLCDYTRISKSYLGALEEEDYNRLPAVVYVRGFLQQIGKRLKLPVEVLSQKYISRMKTARPDKM